MQDIEFYKELLGVVALWRVRQVTLSVKEQRADVWVEPAEGQRWACLECGTPKTIRDHIPVILS